MGLKITDKLYIVNDNGTRDITDVCDCIANYSTAYSGATRVPGIGKGTSYDVNLTTLSGSSYQFPCKGSDDMYDDPLNNRYIYKGEAYGFVPKYGIITSPSTTTIAGNSAGNGSKSIYCRTVYNSDTEDYKLQYSLDNSAWKTLKSRMRQFNVAFCGSGATGTSEGVTAFVVGVSISGGGGGGGAATAIIKVIPTHKSTSTCQIFSGSIAQQSKYSGRSEFEDDSTYYGAGGYGHVSYAGYSSNISLSGVSLKTNGGNGGSGSSGGSGGTPYLTWGSTSVNINNILSKVANRTGSITSDSITTTVSGDWFMVKNSSGENLYKWHILTATSGASGGAKCNSGSSKSGSIYLNNNLNSLTKSFSYSGGNGFNADDPAAPAGGGASLLGRGQGWSSAYFSGTTFNWGISAAGYGGGGCSGVAYASTYILGLVKQLYPGWGGGRRSSIHLLKHIDQMTSLELGGQNG